MENFIIAVLLLSIISAIFFKTIAGKFIFDENKNKKFFRISVIVAILSFVIYGVTTNGKETKTVVNKAENVITISPTTQPKKDGVITLDDISSGVLLVNPLNKKTNFDGDRLIIYSEDGKTNITLVGTKDNISSIRLNLNDLKNSDITTNNTGTLLVNSIVTGAFPKWTEADKWLKDAYKGFSTSKEEAPSKKTVVENKTIVLTYNTELSSLYLTIESN